MNAHPWRFAPHASVATLATLLTIAIVPRSLPAQVQTTEIIYVAIAEGIPKDLRKTDVNGNSQRLFSTCFFDVIRCTYHDPALSPDGRRVALVINHESETGNNYSVWITNLAGGDRKQVTTVASPSSHPAWSPDGRYLAYQRGSSIHEVDLCRDRLPTAGRLVAAGTHPTYSPDSRWIAFGRSGDILKVRRTGGSETPLHNISLLQKDPQWTKPQSPVEKIVFLQMMSDGYRLYTMNPDGSGATQTVTTGGPMESPDAAVLPNVLTWEQDGTVWVQIGTNPAKALKSGRDASFGAGTRRIKTMCP